MTAVVTGVGRVLPDGGPVDPAALIGRKGLRYKDRATQLAWCAADAALRDAGLLLGGTLTVPGATVGVVASSNLGNVDTVCRVVDTIAEETAGGTHPMDLPNASSNVVASSVAIRYGLRGPNLMLCNGATSGRDAMYWADVLIAAGRASRFVVLDVEPDNAYVRTLTGGPGADGAVAVVLEDAAAAHERGAAVREFTFAQVPR